RGTRNIFVNSGRTQNTLRSKRFRSPLVRHAHTVASVPFGVVERFVGAAGEFGQAFAAGTGGYAEACSNPDLRRQSVDGLGGKYCTHGLSEQPGGCRVG